MKVPVSEVEARIVALQTLLAKAEVDVAIIRQNADMFYLTGTVQDGCLLVPATGAPAFHVHKHVGRAEEQSPLHPIHPMKSLKDLPSAVETVLRGSQAQRIGLELDVLPANTFFFFDEKLFPKQQIVDVSEMVRKVRMVKSEWEIGMMKGAATISKAIAEAVPSMLKEGTDELEMSIELERVGRRAGNMGIVRLRAFNLEMFHLHVLSGMEAASPAYADAPTGGEGVSPAFGQGPCSRKIRRGEVLSVDIMMSFHGYLNDQTRNFCIGEPPDRLKEGYALVREIHERFKEAAVPGTVTGELYDRVCTWVAEAGWADHFMGYGENRVSFVAHGLGLEVDEFPFIAQGQKLELQKGMIFAFEPKLIVPGLGITGLENTYLVTEKGLVSLNEASEEMVCV